MSVIFLEAGLNLGMLSVLLELEVLSRALTLCASMKQLTTGKCSMRRVIGCVCKMICSVYIKSHKFSE